MLSGLEWVGSHWLASVCLLPPLEAISVAAEARRKIDERVKVESCGK